jgi:hypothetical protein
MEPFTDCVQHLILFFDLPPPYKKNITITGSTGLNLLNKTLKHYPIRGLRRKVKKYKKMYKKITNCRIHSIYLKLCSVVGIIDKDDEIFEMFQKVVTEMGYILCMPKYGNDRVRMYGKYSLKLMNEFLPLAPPCAILKTLVADYKLKLNWGT